VDADTDGDADSDTDSDTDPDTGTDTGSETASDTSTIDDSACPFDSGFPCSCSGATGQCDDGSSCMNYGNGAGICAFGCTEETAEICTETDGWGFQGWCIFGSEQEPQYCGVMCYFAEEHPCPPGQWCAPLDPWVGVCLVEGWQS
jgi:hypothetical protein